MIKTDLGEIIYSFSKALDLSANGIADHHKTVALIAVAISEKLKLNDYERNLLFLSALVHDAGIISESDAEKLLAFEDTFSFEHCQKGFEIFSVSEYTKEIANIILHHHERWDTKSNLASSHKEIPISSNIIYLADRVAVAIEGGEGYILNRNKEILDKILARRGTLFNPVVVDAFLDVAKADSFWLDLQSEMVKEFISQQKPQIQITLRPNELLDIAFAFSKVIDAKSPYTYHHSSAVAIVAEFLADKFCFSEYEKTMIKVAGYLHDLGKISVPNAILDKQGKLTREEFAIIKKHSYYSYRLLQNIPGFELVTAWGPHHHEKLDGSGYPFKLKGEQITLGAKIMAVSDMFVALTEDRPYRQGLSRDECLHLLLQASQNGKIDSRIVDVTETYYDEIVALLKSDRGA